MWGVVLATVLHFTLPGYNGQPGPCPETASALPLSDLGWVQLVLVSGPDTTWGQPRNVVGREGQPDSFTVEVAGTVTAYVRTSDTAQPAPNWSCLSNPRVVIGSDPVGVGDYVPGLGLGPIAPMPVKDRAAIAWHSPPGVPVVIEVYDVGSRVVSRYRNDTGGRGVWLWDAGKRPSGVYLVRMLAGGEAIRRKMVVLR